MPVAMIKLNTLEPVREQQEGDSGRMNIQGAKMMRAGQLLINGFSREQVCARMSLPPHVVERMEIALNLHPYQARQEMPDDESWDAFRARKKGEIGKKLVGLVERHIEAQEDVAQLSGGLLDKDEMATVRDASVITHKWLNEEKDAPQGPKVAISFSALAQVSPIPDAADQARPVYELPTSAAVSDGEGADWLEG